MSKVGCVVAALVLGLGVSSCRPATDPADGGSGGGTGGGTGGGAGGGTGGGTGSNHAPAWGELATLTVDEGAVGTVQLSATDEDGDTVTFEVTGGAPFATLAGSTLTLSPQQTDEGDYVLQLSASDGKTSTPAELVVLVNRVNVAPVLESVQDVTVAPGATATVTLVATDSDNDPLTLTPSGLPAFATLSGDTLTFSPDVSVLGVFPVSVTVSDGVLSATQSFQLKVEAAQAPNGAPTVSALQQLGVGSVVLAAGASVAVAPSLTATVVDPDGDEVALEAEVVTAGQPFTGTPNLVGTQSPAASLSPLPVGALSLGNYAWRLRARDTSGNASGWTEYSPGATSFVVLAPAGTATGTVSINAGAAFTGSSTVTLTLTQVSGTIAQMAFSADGNFASATFVPFSPTASFTLPAGDGTKSVYARFKDGVGGTSDAVDTIVLDTTDPTGTLSINGGAAYTKTAAVSVAINPVEGGSGLAGMCVKQFSDSVQLWPTPALNDACYVAFATPASVTLSSEGGRRLVVWLKDAAGNAKALSAAIHYDATAPVTPVKSGVTGGVRSIRFSFDRAAESGSGLDGYALEWCNSLASCTASNTQVVTGIALNPLGGLTGDSYTLTVPNGRIITGRITAVDRAGNRSVPTAWSSAIAHWPFEVTQRAPTANAINALAYQSSNTQYFIAGNKGELYVASSSLAGFQRVDPMTDEDLLAADTTSSYVWLAGSNGYIGRSDDQGATFARQSFSSPVTVNLNGITYAGSTSTSGTITTIRHGYVGVGEGGTIVRSTRTCLSAISCGLSAPGSFAPVTSGTTAALKAVARCTGGPSACAGTGVVLAVGASGTILRSTDAGATWSAMAAPSGYTTATFKAIVQVPGTDKLYVGGTKPSGRPALIVTTTGGTAWDAVTSPSFDDYTDITALGAAPKSSSGSNALFVGGLVGTTPTVSHLALSTSVRSNTNVDAKPASIVSTGFVSGAWAGADGALQKTAITLNAYPSWTNASTGSNAQFAEVRFADNSSDAAMAVGSAGRISLTTNQGVTWSSVAPGSASGVDFNSVWFDGSNAFTVGSGGAIYRASNGGSTWGTQAISGTFTSKLNGVSCRGTSACIAVGDKESILTYSGSLAWAITSTVAASTANYQAVTTYLAGSTPRAVVVGSAGKVEVLNNTTWSKPTSGTSATLYGVAARKTLDGVVVAVGNGNTGLIGSSTPAIIRSTDHGATWSSVSTTGISGALTGVTHVTSNQWLASSTTGAVYQSTDNGLTWSELVPLSDTLSRGSGLTSIHCSNKATAGRTCMAAGRSGGIYLTTSAGQ